jgi:ABC-type sugar transport system ATPase subunit
MTGPILEALNIHKRFPGVTALDDVSVSLVPGETLAVVGENGAGKSTLMKILAGAIHPDEGVIKIDGGAVSLTGPGHAQSLGIGIIYQELSVIDALSVGENVFLGALPRDRRLPWRVDWPALSRETAALLERVGARVSPQTPVHRLSVAQKQLVEIARALARNVRVLILDEPTSALTIQETENLFGIIRSLQSRGVGIIYISHRLEEVFAIAQRVTVLRDGKLISTAPIGQTTHEQLIRLMVGRDLAHLFTRAQAASGPARLEVRGLNRPGVLRDISVAVRPGEIVGVAGLMGSGRTELARSLFGADRAESGEIKLDGRVVRIRSPRDAVRLGIGLVPEDRKLQSMFLRLAVRENISITALNRHGMLAFPSRSQETTMVGRYIESLRIRTPTMEQRAGALSGGNQQKIVLARWLATDPKVLILDEPTRGIDIGAKAEVHALMAQLAEQGVAILMISSELPEILGMSHRVLVMREGAIVAEFPREQATEERIMAAATGQAALIA